MNQNKFLNRMFRKVNGVVWDLASNSLGLQNTNGIYTLNKETTEGSGNAPATVQYSVSVNPFDSFGFAIPAFAQITKLSDVSIGDIVVGETSALGWVIKVNGRSLQLMDQSGMTKNYTPPKLAILNQDGALVVKSLTGLFGQEGASGFSNALLPLLLAGDGLGSGLDDLLPIMLLTQQQAGGNGNALASALPTILMMKAMSGGKGNMENLMLPMILTGGLGGGSGGGLNPMMLLALRDGGLGTLGGSGDSGQFIGNGAPVPSQASRQPGFGSSNTGAVPPLTRTR